MYGDKQGFLDFLGKVGESIYKDNEDNINFDLQSASAEIDGYLAKRYQTPVTNNRVLPLLNDWCFSLSAERAFMRTGGSTIPEKVSKKADNVRKFLRDVANGTLILDAESTQINSGIVQSMIATCDEPVFNRENMTGY